MRVERGVVTHGVALNCDNDVTLFELIAPCGMCHQRVVSLAALGARVPLADLAQRLASHVARRCVLAFAVTQLTGGKTVSTGACPRGTGALA
jgi:lipoyl(octanoyl) transferase